MKIVILDAKTLGSDVDLSGFKQFGTVEVYPTTDSSQLLERVKDADIIVTNKVVIDKNALSVAEKLKLICVAATGYNNIDVRSAVEKKVAVANVAGYSTESVVQTTFGMLFYLLMNLRYYDDYVKSGRYAQNDIFTHIGRPFWEINGKRWGIIGLGTIGRRVAEVAESFGCEVVYYSTSGINRKEKYKRLNLNHLLETSDIVSIHSPLNEKTYNLITLNELKKMKRNAILLNLGRGGIVNEKDLSVALDSGYIAGAGLDVLEKEPVSSNNPLLTVKNKDRLLITPHIAWTSIEARQKLIDEIIENIKAFLEGRERNRVDLRQ
ncbi:D-2-hydroxyacid dehydrogenase [Persephonella sp.]